MDVKGKRVSVVGAAKSGLAAARVLSELGAKVLLSDNQPLERLRGAIEAAKLPENVKLETGGHTILVLEADFIVLSPGVPPEIPILKKAAEKNIPIFSEMEMAFRLSRGRRLVVTGSNGKTTTTTILSEFCRKKFPRVFLGGNIGIPVIEFASQTRDDDIQVLEVSSFQLETIQSFKPDIAVITNFYENHLDRYPSYEAYCGAKERIALNMKKNDWLILNADQPAMEKLAAKVGCKTAWFGHDLKGKFPGVTIRDGFFSFIDQKRREEPLFKTDLVRILGRHNQENIMAASIAALLGGVEKSMLAGVVEDFRGVEHRLEWVRERSGVTYINDSKGTNCAASITALKACRTQVVLIAGGRDKGTELRSWVTAVKEKARGVVLLGEARERFRAALEGIVPIRMAKSFDEGVKVAVEWAEKGDTVLFSPACSSYDMFPNFEIRGKAFKELIMALPRE